ncbi:hypothetical protein JJB07_14560 [Tumebacillus sp. ITR2]|uniref:Uncharacterized protein n=1 Tax=Tumebacillus amylolyticus TaxID=2801339 RepID=A0ABS1JCC5_9BACL|nr:hypothetical protein [Tumebacillus amylolyticus]MBL0387860.1 hypothetical protein [Tumebacillus amylolyticus]
MKKVIMAALILVIAFSASTSIGKAKIKADWKDPQPMGITITTSTTK